MKLFLAFIIAFTSSFGFGATKTILKGDIVEGIVGVQELIGAKGHFEKNAIGWNGFDDGAATSPVDGTGGATITTTCTRTTSSPIDGDGSLLITKLGANYQGEGCSLDFTIPANLSGTVLRGSFDYAISSGTYADDAVQVWLYNVTDGALVQPAPTKIKNHTLNKQTYDFEFQPTYGTSAKTWRVILHIAASDSNAYTIKIDNWKLGAYPKNYGSPVTDWVSYTPTLTRITSSGSSAENNGRWRRVGDSMWIESFINLGSTGSGSAGSVEVSIPAGYSIDTAKTARSNGEAIGLSGYWYDSSATDFKTLTPRSGSTTTITYAITEGTGTASNLDGSSLGANDHLRFVVCVPILGWSSSQVMSSDADTRVVNLVVGRTSSAVTANTTIASWSTPAKDSHRTFNATTGVYTVAVPGDYYVNLTGFLPSSGSASPKIIKGSTTIYGNTATAATTRGQVYGLIPNCVAGDTITVQSDTSTTLGSELRLEISKQSGPSQIMASETVSMYSGINTPTGTLTSSYNVTKFGTIASDTHGAYSTSTGLYTAPSAGRFRVSGVVEITASSVAGNNTAVKVGKNGSTTGVVTAGWSAIGTETSIAHSYSFSGTVSLLAGETVAVYSLSQGSSPSYSAILTGSYLSIERVGNY